MKNLVSSLMLSMVAATAFAMAPVEISDIAVENVGCNGPATGALRVTAVGGSGTYNFTITAGPVLRPAQPSGEFLALPAGVYTVVVSDVPVSGVAQATIAVGDVQPLAIASLHTESADCFGDPSGIIAVTVVGGKLPLTFAITNPSTTPPILTDRSAIFTGLAAGPHTITVNSADACVAAVVTAQVAQPAALALIDPTLVQPSCNGGTDGSITINVTGGVAPYTFTLDGRTQVGNATFANVAAGTYTARVSDANGCGISQSITLEQPTNVQISPDTLVRFAECLTGRGGEITVIATAPAGTVLSYSLDGGAPQSSNVFTNVSVGSHTIRVESVPFVAGFCAVRTDVEVGLVRGATGNPLTDFISAKYCGNRCAA